MLFRQIEKNGTDAETLAGAETKTSEWIDVGGVGGDSYSCQALCTVVTPGAKTFAAAAVNVTDDTITINAHGYTEGLKGQVSNPGTLPTGITAVTDYFVIVVDANTIKLASSLANAQAGTAINITAQGSGTNTFTPTTFAGGSIKLQQSNDKSNVTDLGSATSVTTTAVVYLEKDRPTCRYIRVWQTVTAGYLSSQLNILVKGDLS